MPGGRPPMFKKASEMQPLIDQYFADCEADERPATVAGLAYALGFTDRHAISEYADKPEFSATVKRAKLRIEMKRSEDLVKGTGNVTGMIFDLKNNYDWKDKQELDHHHDMTVKIESDDAGTL